MNQVIFSPVQRPLDIKNRPRIPIPDEDPYSVAENVGSSGGSSGSSGFVANMNGSGIISRQLVIRKEMKIFDFQHISWGIVKCS